MSNPSPSPFTIDVSNSVITDLQQRLHHTRWPDQMPGVGWDYGAELTAVQRLCAYWADEYDWPAAQARLNTWPQFTTTIDDQNVHFIHASSPHADAMPLVVTHGWPGSIAEFEKILGPLTDPVAHGGSAADAFHVVCPSIPGYGFSGPTTTRGWSVQRVARAWAELMANLGYEHYGAQGGDWGAVITSALGVVDAEHLAGIHLNMLVAGPPESADPMDGVNDSEKVGLAAMANFREQGVGYQAIQGTKPQSLAYGLTDSPAGLAGWILEKFREWSDCNGDPFTAFTMDELCTNLTIYWATGTINSSCRLYYETIGPGRRAPRSPRVEVPTGAAIFPKELFQPPRVWANNAYNITHWSRFDRGGHFAALEQPAVLVDDMRAFFRTVR